MLKAVMLVVTVVCNKRMFRIAAGDLMNTTAQLCDGYTAVKFFSKLNCDFFRYFDPINVFCYDKYKQFSG